MTPFQAIAKMRQLSKEGIPFSFSYMSYDRSRQNSKGIVTVSNAKLRSRGLEKYNDMAEFQEEYLNLDTNEPRRFWQCNLMTFNNQALTFDE